MLCIVAWISGNGDRRNQLPKREIYMAFLTGYVHDTAWSVRPGIFPIILFACSILVLATTAEAKKLYRFQTEDGTWSYTDKEPDDKAGVTVSDIKPTKTPKKVVVVTENMGDYANIFASTGYAGPIEVELTLTDATISYTEPGFPAKFLVAAGERKKLASGIRKVSNKAWRFNFKYKTILGDPAARHQPPGPYSLPFPQDRQFRVSQAFNGEFSHNEPSNKYAVDISMPEGTQILAARAGTIMDVVENFVIGGEDSAKYLDKANLVRILHDDGTMAVYAHLQMETVIVAPGRKVKVGEQIGRSGNTGFSRGAHLHFAVQRNEEGTLVSESFQFQGATAPITPVKGALLGQRK